jgi:hypothetical protein
MDIEVEEEDLNTTKIDPSSDRPGHYKNRTLYGEPRHHH